MRSDTSSQVWPSASNKINRARRASSARSVRLLARRVSSISSEFVNTIASLIDAIIVYKWLLQSTSTYFRHQRPDLEGKCATDCATFGKVCNRTNKTLGPTEEGMFQGIDAAAAVAVCQFILPCSYSLPLICSEPLSVRSFAQNHPICRLLCTNCAPRKFFLTHPGCCCRRQVHDRGPCWM
jgi:hypothetical protein